MDARPGRCPIALRCLPPVAPIFTFKSEDGGPAWADAGIIIPWTIYECYGDVGLLDERYASMQRFMDYMVRTKPKPK
jgi:alpha-L-rhamnosidase